MNIRDHSSKFTIYVLMPEVDQGAAIKVTLSKAGYDCYYFQDAEILENRLSEAAPHVLVFSSKGLDGNLNEFVDHARKYNENIKFIVIADMAQFEVLSQYNGFGVEEILNQDSAAIEGQAVWAVDRVCEKTYLTLQNEQLFDQWKEAQNTTKELTRNLQLMQVPASDAGAKIVNYRQALSKEELIQKFISRMTVPVIYFKYLSMLGSFVPTHSASFDPGILKGAGGNLEKDEIKNLDATLAQGRLPFAFADLLRNAFKIRVPRTLPLYVRGHLEGLVIFSEDIAKDVQERLEEDFAVFSLCYSHYSLEQKIDNLEVQDFVTEVFNRAYYLRVMNNEIDRAKRLHQPLSVVKLAIDDFYEIEQSQGEIVRDRILKSLTDAIVKTSRTNDITCRTQANEFAMVLPHCSKKGAALRAERMRRIIESANLVDGGFKVSISLGISEYPSLCDSAASLDETSTKALIHIVDKGGNKICMFKAPDSHKPEFEVAVE